MSQDLNEQNIAEGQTAEGMLTSNEPAEETQAQDGLPDQVSDRTRAEFEKLKQHNQALAEKLAVLEGNIPSTTSVLDELRPSAATANTEQIAGNQSQILTGAHTQQEFVDEGGYVDPSLLNAELAENRRLAGEAKRIAEETQRNIQNFQESEVVRSVHAQFPALDPNNLEHFDRTFYDLVKNELHGQFAQGKRNLLEAAKNANKLYQAVKPNQSQVAQAATEEARVKQSKTISNREVASTQTGTSKGATLPTTHEALVAGTRKGDKDAIYARLVASGN